MTLQFISETRLDEGVLERTFVLGEIPGMLWMPDPPPPAPVPLILLGHPGGLHRMRSRLAARARRSLAQGFAAATIELPGSGQRPTSAPVEQARAELRQAIAAGLRPSETVIDRLI